MAAVCKQGVLAATCYLWFQGTKAALFGFFFVFLVFFLFQKSSTLQFNSFLICRLLVYYVCTEIIAHCLIWCVGVDNWFRLHTKLVSLCPEFPKDSEVYRKKWSSIYNDYKEDKAMNMRSGSDRSDKCRWYQLVDKFMSDRTHVVSHAHASATNSKVPNKTFASDTFTVDHKSDESFSKTPEPSARKKYF